MPRRRTGLLERRLLLAVCAVLAAGPSAAQDAPPQQPAHATPGDPHRRLRVATYEDPPYSMRDESGQWTGLAIELWRLVADRMNVDYDITTCESADQGYALLNDGTLDVLAAANPITLQSIETTEMSAPFLSKAYAIATLPRDGTSLLDAFAGPLARRLHGVLIALASLFVVASLLIWWIERRHNPEHFGGGVASGIGNGFWWTATTMTTVGYGDRTPVTTCGRVVAIAVMLLSLILVSILTAILASRLTIVELQPRITGIADLSRVRVGVTSTSLMTDYLRARSIAFATFPDLDRAVAVLAAGELDAVLGGEAELRYLAETRYEGRLVLVPGPIDQGFVAFGIPAGSPLRREIDAALLRVLESNEWRQLRQAYLGR